MLALTKFVPLALCFTLIALAFFAFAAINLIEYATQRKD